MQQNNVILSEWLKDKGVSLVGFADLHGVDAAEKQSMPYGVCIAITLNVFPSVSDTPSPAYVTAPFLCRAKSRTGTLSRRCRLKRWPPVPALAGSAVRLCS